MARFDVAGIGRWPAVLWMGIALGASAQQGPALSPEPLSSKEAARLLVNRVTPDYPAVAQVNYIQGQVDMLVVVGANGHVRRAHVLNGHPLLAAAAMRAIQTWVYRPFVTEAGAKPFSTLVKVRFSLREHDLEHSPSTPERDLAQAVKPPEILGKTAAPTAGPSIRMQVLVGEDGRAIDSTLLSGPAAMFASAQRSVSQWEFRPARWGNLTVPWYLDVDVPVDGAQSLKAWAAPPPP